MADEQEVGVIFPLAGLETTCEFGRQPVDTAAQGVNVRSFESLTARARGGSRSGLSQYVPQQVRGLHEVQELNVLIDPQDPALDAGSDLPPGDPGVEDPQHPGRFVRTGGSGIPMAANVGQSRPPPSFKQQTSIGYFGGDASPSDRSITLPSPVTAGGFVLFAIELPSGNSDDVASVTDNQGNAYTLVQGIVPAGLVTTRLNVYRTKPSASGSLTITASCTGSPTVLGSQLAAVEYAGVNASSPVVDSTQDAAGFTNAAGVVTATAPKVNCLSNANLAVCVFQAPLGTQGGTPVTSLARAYETVPAAVPAGSVLGEAVHGPATGDVASSSRLLVAHSAGKTLTLTAGGVVQSLSWDFAGVSHSGNWLAVGLSIQA